MESVTIPSSSADAGVASLQANVDVVRVEVDSTRDVGATPDDTNYSSQWSLPKIGWDQVYGTVHPSGSATVAVLDTGVNTAHPDLEGQLEIGTSILDGSAGMTDPNGHGTAMAGIVAAATNNGIGIAGVAFAGVKVMPVTVLGADGTGKDSDVIAGVVWATDHGADVILMAFSNPGFSSSLQLAIDYAWSKGRGCRRRDRQRRVIHRDVPRRRPWRHRRLEYGPDRRPERLEQLRRRYLPGSAWYVDRDHERRRRLHQRNRHLRLRGRGRRRGRAHARQ